MLNADWSNRRRGGRRHLPPPSVSICTTSGPRLYTGPAADARHTPTGATTGTAGPSSDGAACGDRGGAGAAYGTGCVADDCFRCAAGTVRVRTGGGQAAVAPEKAAAASQRPAVGREAAHCRPWHRVVADERCQRRNAVRGGDGRQRQRRSRSLPRWHRNNIQKCNKCMRSAPYSLAFRTGCSHSVVMHTYTYITGLALRFRAGSLHPCPQGSEDVSALEGSR